MSRCIIDLKDKNDSIEYFQYLITKEGKIFYYGKCIGLIKKHWFFNKLTLFNNNLNCNKKFINNQPIYYQLLNNIISLEFHNLTRNEEFLIIYYFKFLFH